MAETSQEWRCTKCKKMLGKVNLTHGTLEVACKCGTKNTITATPPRTNFVYNEPYQDRRLNLVKK